MQLTVPRYGSDVPGLPVRAIPFSNSERESSACLTRWWFGYVEGLTFPGTHPSLRYGTSWHYLMQQLHEWWMLHDSEYPSLCAEQAVAELHAAQEHLVGTPDGCATGEELANEMETLHRAFEGYLEFHGAEPPRDHRVIAVEQKLAVPILTPNGTPYAPTTWMVREPGGFRLGKTGESYTTTDNFAVNWPWYQVLTIDAIYQHRENGSLVVWEGKSSANPKKKTAGISVDPQLAGYCWALQKAIERGVLREAGISPATRVSGWEYDVTWNGFQPDPQPLAGKPRQRVDDDGNPLYLAAGGVETTKKTTRKSWERDELGEQILYVEGMSRAQATRCPTWRYRAGLREHGFNEADYEDHLLYLAHHVDAQLYDRTHGVYSREVSRRYEREIFAVAKKLSTVRRSAFLRPLGPGRGTVDDISDVAYRTPVCTMIGGSCPYKGPCTMDGEIVRRNYELQDGPFWSTTGETEEAADMGF